MERTRLIELELVRIRRIDFGSNVRAAAPADDIEFDLVIDETRTAKTSGQRFRPSWMPCRVSVAPTVWAMVDTSSLQ